MNFQQGIRALLLVPIIALVLLVSPRDVVRAGIFGDFTIRDEVELGRKFNMMIRSSMPMIEDPVVAGYVRDMVQRIARGMPPQPFALESAVIRNGALNAFATAGGYVYVFSGLILNADHEAELAGVVAHELAHVSQRHIARSIEQSQLAGLGTLAGMLAGAFLGAQSSEAGQAVMFGALASSRAAQLKYSREHEEEADQVGLHYLMEARYPPQGLVDAFQKIRRLSWLGGSSIPSYLSTHPGVEERIGYLADRIAGLPQRVRTPEVDESRFLRVRELVRARYSPAEDALPYYEVHETTVMEQLGKAIVLSRLNRISEAEEQFRTVLNAAGRGDPLILREAGRFFYEYGNLKQAAMYLQEAVIKAPHDLMAQFFYARILSEMGQEHEAVGYLQNILHKLPDDGEVHYYLGRTLGKTGSDFRAHLHLCYAALYRREQSRLRFHLQKARKLADSEDRQGLLEELEKTIQERKEMEKG
jgi:predicted Zn-dependent protease